jgi:hypothetical protein
VLAVEVVALVLVTVERVVLVEGGTVAARLTEVLDDPTGVLVVEVVSPIHQITLLGRLVGVAS